MSTSADPEGGPAPSEAPVYATRDQLRAMAHPLRMQILERIGRRGTARAADIAADLGVPANSVSYHLRTLARGGVIVEAPDAARDRRDRVWTLTQVDFQQAPAGQPETSTGVVVDHDYVAASAAMSLAVLDGHRAAWAAETARRQASFPEPREAQAPAMLFSSPLRISRAQARELFDTVVRTLHEYNRLNRDESGRDLPGDPDSPDGAENVQLLFGLLGERPPAGRSEDPSGGRP